MNRLKIQNMLRLLCGLLIVNSLFNSCVKDDNDKSSKKNYLKIGDEEYDLSAGFLQYNDDGDSWHYGHKIWLYLYSDGLSSFIKEGTRGKGHSIEFMLFSKNKESLNNADYTFSSSEPHPIGTFSGGWYSIDYDTETEEYEQGEYIKSGKVSISKSGNGYIISINCTDKNGTLITGFYKGKLRYFD